MHMANTLNLPKTWGGGGAPNVNGPPPQTMTHSSTHDKTTQQYPQQCSTTFI